MFVIIKKTISKHKNMFIKEFLLQKILVKLIKNINLTSANNLISMNEQMHEK